MTILDLTILSPHRDDAIFSLALALSRWVSECVRIRVVNFFTESAYAPGAFSTLVSGISALREREDRRALALLSRRIRVESLGLLDAPLRLNISSESISDPGNATLQPPGEVETLYSQIQKYLVRGLVIAPLGLGNHIDHVAVKRAALMTSAPQKLAFYEDLPYAVWTPADVLAGCVSQAEKQTALALRPLIVRNRRPVVSKFHLVRQYQSQVGRGMALTAARYAIRYRGGERIWIPRYGAAWDALVSRSC